MLAIPPFGASSNIALWRANIKPPVELVVDDLDIGTLGNNFKRMIQLVQYIFSFWINGFFHNSHFHSLIIIRLL